MDSRRGLRLAFHLAGLVGTGWVVWTFSVLPRLAREPLPKIVADAAVYALLAGICGALILLATSLSVAQTRAEALRLAWRSVPTAVWFAPAVLVIGNWSPVTVAAAIMLTISATQLLYGEWREGRSLPLPATEPAGPFGVLPAFSLADLAPTLTSAALLQLAAVAIGSGLTLWGGFCLCASAALLTISVLHAGLVDLRRPDLPQSVIGLLLTLVLAAGLTVGAAFGPGGDGDGEGLEKVDSHDAVTLYDGGGDSLTVRDDAFPGVVLRVKPPQRRRDIRSPRPSLPGWLGAAEPELEAIPFSGEYWIYKPPYRRPPRDSMVREGNARELSYFTSDHRPLRMEAHQRLEHPLSVACCSAIRVAISNADRYSGTVSLELILVGGGGRQSLGTHEVRSHAARALRGQPTVAAGEFLDFAVPSSGAVKEFSEIEVVFHRAAVREDRSAQVAIERFLLIPPA